MRLPGSGEIYAFSVYFSVSHICEKARWALYYLYIPYELVSLAPGLHSVWASRCGLTSTTLPTLEIDGIYTQGAGDIIDWVEQRTSTLRRLTPENDASEVRALEQRFGESIGFHTRRMFYSEALLEYPATVKPRFLAGLSILSRLFTQLMWPVIRKGMIRGMELGPKQG
ncbi:hypothetical protein BST95_01755 [Halioglobus japonicus]|nr:hypothetical protein BST95_01755 [Halioglobus japonicus]GHD19156.1 hypothetical protein GCM10007052_27280 [Halioglobus japonicus]